MIKPQDAYLLVHILRTVQKEPLPFIQDIFDRWLTIGRTTHEYGGLTINIGLKRLEHRTGMGEFTMKISGLPDIHRPSNDIPGGLYEREAFLFSFEQSLFFDKVEVSKQLTHNLEKYLGMYDDFEFKEAKDYLGERVKEVVHNHYPNAFSLGRSNLINRIGLSHFDFLVVVEPKVLGGKLRLYPESTLNVGPNTQLKVKYDEFTI